jgi:hypothetical protein
VKKGRHRRYEEARALKRGPDLDIEAIFDDLESDRGPAPVVSPPLDDPAIDLDPELDADLALDDDAADDAADDDELDG